MFNLICTDEKARNELIFIHAIIKNNNINIFNKRSNFEKAREQI